jgi:hypothetical protein|tara:strand:+ start:2667 stop:2906 length:240 start_codon:yes stop_codon:yes gene_type:complete
MIEWILKRLEEGLNNEYYKRYYKKKDAIESLFLCDSCDMVWSIAKETNYRIACYYKDLPKYGQNKKKCPHCVEKSGVGK